LARRGRQVTVLERGGWQEWPLGTPAAFATIARLSRSRQGGIAASGVTAGGSSVIFNGNAFDPPGWLAAELFDLGPEVAALRSELKIQPLPEAWTAGWKGSRALRDSAAELGFFLRPQDKFIDPDRCRPGCDRCMFGCRRGAKWTARDYLQSARELGARIITRSRAVRVIVAGGRAMGVEVKAAGFEEVRAERVVLAAGGIETPVILQRSGVEAGRGFFVDPMNVVIGIGPGCADETTFSFATDENEDRGFLIGTLGAGMGLGGLLLRDPARALLKAARYRRVTGLFVKIADDSGGGIGPDGRIDKIYSAADRERFRRGTDACVAILTKAGTAPESMTITHDLGGHPGGGAAVGKVVDRSLQTLAVQNLFVCDASVLPRSLGRPPTLTLMAMARKTIGGW
jgi:choline dehydrogenase-like flavoprotein